MIYKLVVVMLMLSTTQAFSFGYSEINSVASTPAGITFNYGGGNGQGPWDILIKGQQGSDCLAMYLKVDSMQRAKGNVNTPDEGDVKFEIIQYSLEGHKCYLQVGKISH